MSTLSNQQNLGIFGDVADHLICLNILNYGSHRNADIKVLAALASALATHTVNTALCLELALMTKIYQGIKAFVANQIDTATGTAITPIGAAKGHIFFAPKTGATVATIAGRHSYSCFINKFHNVFVQTDIIQTDRCALKVQNWQFCDAKKIPRDKRGLWHFDRRQDQRAR